MTGEQLKGILERLEKATPGPWKQVEEIDGIYAGRKTVVNTRSPYSGQLSRVVCVGQTRRHISQDAEYNAEFIAHAREDIPILLAEIERLHKIIDSEKETAK